MLSLRLSALGLLALGASAQNSIAPIVSDKTYDYIIAGGGPAGIIAAERIAEAGYSVLLLERGPVSTYSSGNTEETLSWNDTITPFDVPGFGWWLSEFPASLDKYCSDVDGYTGCLLGGGSSVNALLFMKPPARDFDDKWPAGWKWEDVSSAADRLYSRNPGQTLSSVDGEFHDQTAYEIMSKHFESNGWTSVDAIEDTNSKHQVFTHTPYNTKDGLRAGPVRTYLPLAQKLPNFTLQLGSMVIRAVRSNSTVTGVEAEVDGTRYIYNVNPKGRVILAAGALSTPRILFRSAIGPEEQIQNVASGETQVTLPEESSWINLPVGKATKDHTAFLIQWNIKAEGTEFENKTSLSPENLVNPSVENQELFDRGSGPLAQGVPRLDSWTSFTDETDGQVRYIQSSWWAATNTSMQQVLYLTHGLTSTGVLSINATGYMGWAEKPWATTDGDRAAIESYLDELLAYSRLPGSLLEWPVANATGESILTETGAGAGNHFVGSTPLGLDDGREGGAAVVDLDTKVYGTDNLFVVDGSFHADLPTGNTQAIVMVAAERAAEKILALAGGPVSA